MAYNVLDISAIQPLNPACEVDLSRRSSKSEVGSPKGGAPNLEPITLGSIQLTVI